MKILHYTVLIVAEAQSSDNNINPLILDFLHDRNYSSKSNRGVKLPPHAFVGSEGQAVLEWESEKDGAEKLKKKTLPDAASNYTFRRMSHSNFSNDLPRR